MGIAFIAGNSFYNRRVKKHIVDFDYIDVDSYLSKQLFIVVVTGIQPHFNHIDCLTDMYEEVFHLRFNNSSPPLGVKVLPSRLQLHREVFEEDYTVEAFT